MSVRKRVWASLRAGSRWRRGSLTTPIQAGDRHIETFAKKKKKDADARHSPGEGRREEGCSRCSEQEHHGG